MSSSESDRPGQDQSKSMKELADDEAPVNEALDDGTIEPVSDEEAVSWSPNQGESNDDSGARDSTH